MKDSTRRLMTQIKHQHKNFAGNWPKSRRQIRKAIMMIRKDQKSGNKV